jgi:uncharacterized protein YegJ (DUF2314 family)
MGAAAGAIVVAERRMVEAFETAGATSAATALSPDDVGVDSTSLSWRRLTRRAVIREASPGSGLYYLDREVWQALRRTRMRLLFALLIVIAGIWFYLSITGVVRGSVRMSPPPPPADPNARSFRANSPDLSAATREARDRLPFFLARVQHPLATQNTASAKVRLLEGTREEQMWLSDLSLDGKLLHGRLNDTPVAMTRLHANDTLSVPVADLTDWLIMDSSRLCGGYSLRVVRRFLPAAQQARFDKTFSPRGFASDTATCANLP